MQFGVFQIQIFLQSFLEMIPAIKERILSESSQHSVGTITYSVVFNSGT